MDAHSQMILEQYRQNVESYKIIKDLVLGQLKQFVFEMNMLANSVEGRIKTEQSLIGKLELKGLKYKSIKDITDIVGCRVVTFYSDEVDKVAAKVTSVFNVDWANSIDKRKIYKVDQFGYMSLHYICSIPKSLYFNENHPEINELKFEIQLRSVLQHTWATIYHDTGYKNDVEIPIEYLRQLNRLAGMLELADEQFRNIRLSLSAYRRRVKQIVADGKLGQVELNGDSYKAYLDAGAFDALNYKISTINDMEIEHVSLRNFLYVFKSFKFQTLKDLDNFKFQYEELAYRLCIHQFGETDIDIITTATGPFSLCVVYLLDHGAGEPDLVNLLTTVYGEKRSHIRYAKNLINIGKKLGIVKED